MEFLISFGYATPDGKPGSIIKPEKSPAPAPAPGKQRKTGAKSGGSFDAIVQVLNNTDAPYAQKVNGGFTCRFSKRGSWS